MECSDGWGPSAMLEQNQIRGSKSLKSQTIGLIHAISYMRSASHQIHDSVLCDRSCSQNIMQRARTIDTRIESFYFETSFCVGDSYWVLVGVIFSLVGGLGGYATATISKRVASLRVATVVNQESILLLNHPD